MADLSRRQWLRAASGLFVAAPIAHSVFAPKFGAWFRQLFRPRFNPYEWNDWIIPTETMSLEEAQRRYNEIYSKIADRIADEVFRPLIEADRLLGAPIPGGGRWIERTHWVSVP